jgi:hypothetical protein
VLGDGVDDGVNVGLPLATVDVAWVEERDPEFVGDCAARCDVLLAT